MEKIIKILILILDKNYQKKYRKDYYTYINILFALVVQVSEITLINYASHNPHVYFLIKNNWRNLFI